MAYKWSTREEWAYRRQHPYWDSETGCPFDDKYSHRLSDYATADEIAALTMALKNLYRELGRALRVLNQHLKPVSQRKGEGWGAWYQRFLQLPPKTQETLHAAQCVKDDRRQINGILARIDHNKIPDHTKCGGVLGKPAEWLPLSSSATEPPTTPQRSDGRRIVCRSLSTMPPGSRS
jgi:hypothetical protein